MERYALVYQPGSAGGHGDDLPVRPPTQHGVCATIQEVVSFFYFFFFYLVFHMFRYSCNPIALFDAPMSKGLGEGNSSALIKRTLQKEVFSGPRSQNTCLRALHFMFKGEGRQTVDNLDRL